MAVKRKIRKGLAGATLCVLANEGAASEAWLAGRFGVARSTMDRVLAGLERRGLVRYSTLHGGKPAANQRGVSVVFGKCPVRYHEVLRKTRSLTEAARAAGVPEPPGKGPLPGGYW